MFGVQRKHSEHTYKLNFIIFLHKIPKNAVMTAREEDAALLV